ncbi:MAG: hypothetical protein JXR83_19920, partial [Deltaproteobacteria bacterium]|nr:hypothetical protein [Deltaproteobacteria bacterium]
ISGGSSPQANVGIAVATAAKGPTIRANQVVGAADPVAAVQSIGIVLSSQATLGSNSIRGGHGATATGLQADCDPYHLGLRLPFDFSSNADVIVGGSGTTAVGVALKNLASGIFQAVDVTAPDDDANPLATRGVEVQSSANALFEGGSIRSGNAAQSTLGVIADELANSVTLRSVQVIAGHTTLVPAHSIGVVVRSGSLLIESLAGGEATTIDAGSGDDISQGIDILCAGPTSATHAITDAVIRAGDIRGTAGPLRASIGIGISGCPALELDGNQVTAGAAPNGDSYGLHASATVVHSNNDSFLAGAASGVGSAHSAAVRVDNAALRASAITAVGNSGKNSYGIWLQNASESEINGGGAIAGAAAGASGGSLSNGIRLTSDPIGQLVSRVSIIQVTAVGGTSAYRSAGIHLDGLFDELFLADSTASGGSAPITAGLYLSDTRQTSTNLNVVYDRLSGGTAVATASGSAALTAGAYFGVDCRGCNINRNIIGGGALAAGSPGRSVGARFTGAADSLAAPTLIHGNVIRGGPGADARGLELDGTAGDGLRVVGNTIFGGGTADAVGTISHGVYLGHELASDPAANPVGVLVGNIIDPGVNTDSYNIFENARCLTALGLIAEPYWENATEGGRNNNLWPPGNTALVRDAHLAPSCGTANVTLLTDVDDLVPYRAGPTAEDHTWSVDPIFLADRYHICAADSAGCSASSPMRERGIHMLDWQSAYHTMLDIDAEQRPRGGGFPDIGCDEVP